jgi:dTDP-glucose 4,6-dehydratase/UDP-glucose 4-epimerase
MNVLADSEVLVTGGAGFIGSTLARKLLKFGANVTILDAMIVPYGGNEFNFEQIKSKITFIKADIRSKKHVESAVKGKDYIFHLAAQTGRVISMDDSVFDTEINCLGTLNILTAIRKQKKKPKLLFASSRGVIGKPEYLPVDENHPQNPLDVYGINKLTNEKYCFLYSSHYGFDVSVLRLNNVYGPRCQIRSNHYGTINLFVSYALQNKVLPIYGDGLQTRDYIYVDDIVDAFITAIHPKANGKLYFIGTGIATNLLDVIDIIKALIPNTYSEYVQFPFNLKSVDFPDFYSTSLKFENELGWKPKFSLQEGIKQTVDFYTKNLKHYL